MKPHQWLRIKSYKSVPFDSLEDLPEISGIYYALRGFDLLYIGQSQDIYDRWNGRSKHGKHYQLDKYGCRLIHYRPVPESRLRYIEAKEIKRLNPQFNIQRPNPMHWLTPRLFLEFAWEWLSKGAIAFLTLALIVRFAWLILL